MTDQASNWLSRHQWFTPALLVAIVTVGMGIFSCQLNNIEGRITNLDTKIDRRGEAIEERLAKTNERLDSGLEAQSGLATKLNKVDSAVEFVREQFKSLERRLEPSSAPQVEIIR